MHVVDWLHQVIDLVHFCFHFLYFFILRDLIYGLVELLKLFIFLNYFAGFAQNFARLTEYFDACLTCSLESDSGTALDFALFLGLAFIGLVFFGHGIYMPELSLFSSVG